MENENNIASLRSEYNVSAKDLSSYLGITRTQLIELERNQNVSRDVVDNIEKAIHELSKAKEYETSDNIYSFELPEEIRVKEGQEYFVRGIASLRLKYYRDLKGYSIDNMAKILDMSTLTYSNYESGRNRFRSAFISQISSLLDAPEEVFFNDLIYKEQSLIIEMSKYKQKNE